MALKKYLNPKNDKAFKRIFGTEKNKDILIHFLNDIFGRTSNPIEEVTIENPAQDSKIASERTSYIDVFCRDTEGNRFIVKMQVANEIGFIKRAQYYAARTYIEQRDQGINYNDLKEIIFLAITDFTVFPKKASYLSHHAMLDQASYKRDLKDFSFSFLELPKFKSKKEELVSLTERWAFFFKHAQEMTEEDLDVVIGYEGIIGKAYREIDKFNWTNEELAAYEAEDLQQIAAMNILHTARQEGLKEGMGKGMQEGIEKGMQEGMEKGMQEGMEEGMQQGMKKGMQEGIERGKTEQKLTIVRSMIDKGLDINLIREVTGLSKEAIERLISQGKNQ